MFIFQVSLTDISFPYRIFLSVLVCFLKRSHILACGQTEGLSKWHECINAKMIRNSSLQCLDVAVSLSLCRSVPSHCTEGALQSCSLCWLWPWFEAKEAWRSYKESALFLAQALPSQTVTPAHCVLWGPVGLSCCWCKKPAVIMGWFNFSFFSHPSL